MSYYQRFTIRTEAGEELFQRNELGHVFRWLVDNEYFIKNPDAKLYITENNTRDDWFREEINAATTQNDIQEAWGWLEKGL